MTADVDALFGGAPSVGDLDQAFLFLIVAVSGDELHTLTCEVNARLDADGAAAFALGIRDHRRDGLGIELTPMRFQMAERLHVEERWDRTDRLLDLLEATVSG